MSDVIAKRAEGKISETDILFIAEEAMKDEASGNEVLNASIGSFLEDDKALGRVEPVCRALKQWADTNLDYPPIAGSLDYKNAILKWLLRDQYSSIIDQCPVSFFASLGGTGAINLSMNTFLEEGEAVLLPSLYWSNYTQLAKKANLSHRFYNLFDEAGRFDIASLRKEIRELASKQSRVLAIINDPCQNPTGYSLSKEEISSLFQMLQEEGEKVSLTVCFDIAYLDYQIREEACHPLFLEASKEGLSFLPVFAYSCSKSFGSYGLRLGALIAFLHNKEEQQILNQSVTGLIRGIYSCPVGPLMKAISEALKEEDAIRKCIRKNALTLQRRGKHLAKALDQFGIQHLPYEEGFFLTINVKDAMKLYETLKSKHIYIVPLDEGHARLAVSGLNDLEIDRLAKAIAENQ